MNRLHMILGACVLLAFVLIAARPSVAQEIPLTTTSEEARQAFEEGVVFFENIRREEARARFDEAIQQDPDFAMAHLFRALSSASGMEFQKHLQHAVERAPQASEGEQLLIEGLQVGMEGNATKELELAEMLVEKYPRDKHALGNLAYVYGKQDKTDEAIATYRRVLELDEDYAPAYNALGYAYKEKGDYEEAEKAFQRYVELLPEEANPHDSIADLYTKQGRHDEAITHYAKAIALNPTFFFSQQKIGDNLVFTGRFDEGREAYREALNMTTTPAERIETRLRIADSYLYEERYDEALAELEEVQEAAREEGLPEQVTEAQGKQFMVYYEQGRFDEAAAQLQAVRQVMEEEELPPFMVSFLEKATLMGDVMVAARRGDLEAAQEKATEYKALAEEGGRPEDIEAHHLLLGLIYAERGDLDQASQHYRQAGKNSPYALYQLAVLEAERGNDAEADALFEQVANWNEHEWYLGFVHAKARKEVAQRDPRS